MGKVVSLFEQLEEQSKLSEGNETIFVHSKTRRPPVQNLNEVIAVKIVENLKPKTRKFPELFHVLPKTMKRIRQEELHMMKVNFKWIPYEQNITQLQTRV